MKTLLVKLAWAFWYDENAALRWVRGAGASAAIAVAQFSAMSWEQIAAMDRKEIAWRIGLSLLLGSTQANASKAKSE